MFQTVLYPKFIKDLMMHSILVKPRLISKLSLLALLLVSCAPAAVTTESPPQPVAPVTVEPSATPVPSGATEGSAVEEPTEVAAWTPLSIATSRGPDLEATDPSTVSLASGGLQFVEFFRFT
jgi:hypothetical protein